VNRKPARIGRAIELVHAPSSYRPWQLDRVADRRGPASAAPSGTSSRRGPVAELTPAVLSHRVNMILELGFEPDQAVLLAEARDSRGSSTSTTFAASCARAAPSSRPSRSTPDGRLAPLRVIGYVRVSTDEQAMSGLGLADQEAQIRQRATGQWKLTPGHPRRRHQRRQPRAPRPPARARTARRRPRRRAGRRQARPAHPLDRRLRLPDRVVRPGRPEADPARPRRRHQHRRRPARRQRHRLSRPVGTRRDQRAHPRRARALRAQGKPSAGPPSPTTRARRADPRDARRGLDARRSPTGSTTSVPSAARWQPSAIQSALGYKRPRRPRKLVELPTPART
jgi:hypothetical protein